MNSIIPNSYEELIELAGKYSHHPKPNVEQILKHLGIEGLSLHAQAPVFYVVDYTQKRYLYVDPSCKEVLGYDADYFIEGGPISYVNNWHKNDLKVFNEKIVPETFQFLRTQKPADYNKFSFSFNYRTTNKARQQVTVLQRSTYFLAAEDGSPLAAVGFIVDITHFKEDTKIIHTIEKVDRNFRSVDKTPVVKSIYFPDKDYGVLSKREMEVLQLMHDGLSSLEISKKLFVSVNTVNNHRRNMLQKTETKNSQELIRFAIKTGLL